MDPERESIDRLFAEEFEPRWMKWQREAAEQKKTEREARLLKHWTQRGGHDIDPIQAKSDAAWRLSAYRTHLAIVARCQGNNYQNDNSCK